MRACAIMCRINGIVAEAYTGLMQPTIHEGLCNHVQYK